MPMLTCPRCRQTVSSQDIHCPYCRTPLKAHGHPGIPLHRATSGEYLCKTCTYDADDTCTYPKRPYARECTLYQNLSEAMQHSVQSAQDPRRAYASRFWWRHNLVWIALAGLVGISLLIALQNQ